MNIVEQLRIDGFWGDKTVDLRFEPDVNFLIGVNGSGKTTVINLLAAALTADFSTIDRIGFDRVVVTVRDTDSGRCSYVQIEKQPSHDLPFPRISYSVTDDARNVLQSYSLDAVEEQLALRDRTYYYRNFPELRRRQGKNIIEHLAALIKTSWLSIHRGRLARDSREDSTFESTVDKKLDDLANGLVRYFSTLEKGGAELVDEFQRKILLALLSPKDFSIALHEVQRLHIEEEKAAIVEICQKIGLNEYLFKPSVDKFFNTLATARDKFTKSEGVEMHDFSTLLETVKLHEIVKDWQSMTEKQRSIFAPRETFIGVLNQLFQRKVVRINEQNEVVANTRSGKQLTLKDLSSGEKQLIIILGEALLQEARPHVYIADEPELSLHVSWQETLIDNIRKINPRAQLIVATHSPDIVGAYSNRVLEIERFIK